MVICYITDDRYAQVTGVSLLSLLDSNKDAQEIIIYIVDDEISSINKSKLSSITQKYKREIHFVSMPDVEEIFGETPVVGRWTAAIYVKLILHRLLPSFIERVIFLDSDTMILRSLSEVWAIDMKEMAVAGVNDITPRKIILFDASGLSYEEKRPFLNGGFYMLNLKLLRLPETENMILSAVNNRENKSIFHDEIIMENVFLDRIIRLPPKYNSFQCFTRGVHRKIVYNRVKKFVPDIAPIDEWKEAFRDPVVIHFGGPSFVRPFVAGLCSHPYKKQYLNFRSQSPWANDMLLPNKNKNIKIVLIYLLYKYFPFIAHLYQSYKIIYR